MRMLCLGYGSPRGAMLPEKSKCIVEDVGKCYEGGGGGGGGGR